MRLRKRWSDETQIQDQKIQRYSERVWHWKRPFRWTGSRTNAQKDPEKGRQKNIKIAGNTPGSSATSTVDVPDSLKAARPRFINRREFIMTKIHSHSSRGRLANSESHTGAGNNHFGSNLKEKIMYYTPV